MPIHRYHPDVENYPSDADAVVLYDDCDRCAEHASNPTLTSLDDHNFARLWEEMVEVEVRPDGRDYYHTRNDGQAARHLFRAYQIHTRLIRLGKLDWTLA
jgi:hypothetical protein